MVSHLLLPYEWVECSDENSCLHVVHSLLPHADLNATPRAWVRAMFPSYEFSADYVCRVDGRKRMHRVDGPAFQDEAGTVMWYLDGEIHREDGPAVAEKNGTQEWWVNGELHREDGPAVIMADGTEEWWKYNERYEWVEGEGVRQLVLAYDADF